MATISGFAIASEAALEGFELLIYMQQGKTMSLSTDRRGVYPISAHTHTPEAKPTNKNLYSSEGVIRHHRIGRGQDTTDRAFADDGPPPRAVPWPWWWVKD